MPHSRRSTLLLLTATTLAAAVGLSGCMPLSWIDMLDTESDAAGPSTAQSAAPSSTPLVPLYGSQQELESKARTTYERYVRVVDEIFHDAGEHPERVDPYAVFSAKDKVYNAAEKFSRSGKYTEGHTEVKAFKYDVMTVSAESTTIVAFTCDDVSHVTVHHADGSVAPDSDYGPYASMRVQLQVVDEDTMVVSYQQLMPAPEGEEIPPSLDACATVDKS